MIAFHFEGLLSQQRLGRWGFGRWNLEASRTPRPQNLATFHTECNHLHLHTNVHVIIGCTLAQSSAWIPLHVALLFYHRITNVMMMSWLWVWKTLVSCNSCLSVQRPRLNTTDRGRRSPEQTPCVVFGPSPTSPLVSPGGGEMDGDTGPTQALCLSRQARCYQCYLTSRRTAGHGVITTGCTCGLRSQSALNRVEPPLCSSRVLTMSVCIFSGVILGLGQTSQCLLIPQL